MVDNMKNFQIELVSKHDTQIQRRKRKGLRNKNEKDISREYTDEDISREYINKRDMIRKCIDEMYTLEYKERTREIEKSEMEREMLYGKRYRYQKEKITKGPGDYIKSLLQRKVEKGILDRNALCLKGSGELLDHWAKERGFRNYEEYLNIIALGRGFTCYGEYEKVWTYYPGMPNPIRENRKNARFLGVYIAESGISKIFEESQRMKYYNPGYDIICPKGYKIDVKATSLNYYNIFNFSIDKNMIADYFVMVAFNNIIELKPLHIWIIKGDENVCGCPIRELNRLIISNEPKYLDIYRKYERIDKLDELKDICNKFDAKNRMEIEGYNDPRKHIILDIVAQLRLAAYEEILPTDIQHILEVKKKETMSDRVKIVPKEDTTRY